ncbi:DUF3365 domain-containing protein [Urbifossiella limnaea]|uniref:DUF3365 domain-containing protein n=1 Tax=Urbifossiella limnaea TaxID=2528023 RepID=A0A517Y3B4_9BACT|nr:DUF3365 domain-containing protein [Urbifossiella limnaea]QDU24275.1 hypothetical protein ETAA1_62890 [Urbifossiella limnaea]
MLYFSFIPAALLLAGAHAAARPIPQPVRWLRFGGWSAFALPMSLFCLSTPVVARLFVLLAVALVAWQLTRRRVRWFLPYSLAAVAVAYGLSFWWAWQDHDALTPLRERYRFESMVDRVPEPRGGNPAGEPLTDLDRPYLRSSQRVRLLWQLHDETVLDFVNRPGFGIGRIGHFTKPSEDNLKAEPRPDPPPQPESPGPAWSLGEVQFAVPLHDHTAASRLHADGLLDFVNPDGSGYVRSRREVAGFLPHAFSRVPEGREWRAVRVELVGLLKHAEPVVYPSDRLPAMADLKDAPTRAPDAFEAAGIDAVRRGEAGFVGRRGDEVRYVGAVRSAEACVKCHGGERGDLLGAFSYRLRPVRVP